MDQRLSRRVQAVKPSPTLAVTNRAAELRASGKDIIGLGAGEPDFDTPEHIKKAGIKAIDNGQTKYTAVDGTPSLKKAIIDKFQRDNGLTYTASQILVSAGGKHSFFNLSLALLDEGDEVIIPAPYWVSYPDMVRIAEGVPVIVEAGADQNFKMTAGQLRAAITDKTRLVVINSPSNPTGTAYSRDELKALGEVLLEHPDVLVATDDMYEHTLWDEGSFVNILNVCPELYEHTIVMNGVSKAYSMTGWRIGYIGGPEWLVKNMKKIQSQSTSNPCSIAQAAAEEALAGPQECVREMVVEFKKRHDYVLNRLNTLPGVKALPADGTFYSFPDFSEAIADAGYKTDVDYAEAVLEAGVALVPGSAFGAPGHMRLSFATSMENLNKALDRLEAFLAK
ncbi:pyridoxal phosphate-dependent aminotransferase [Sansalvadorimonas verongulae]|uniref:pyridoxal phosphate-dependent aminotransferase n=1 Tax=Sansalvadorimonas verongulae TaxID=2172824 RepID=UPI002E35B740|nr:pyridoxal phosphate-dependent aminotransferase [Sansalvadorimonas verongulae]MTI14054.1 pyridoxal phosphate-dependent aminotransferase [Sansalvadorimonas verongulae]